MAIRGVHYLAYNTIKTSLEVNATEYEQVSAELQEALKLGDLRENSEYDAAKEKISKITQERDKLLPMLSMPQLKANDSASMFEEGCVINLKIYNTTHEPMDTRSEAFKKLITETTPVFEGTLLFGGTLPIHELLTHSALSVETPIGAYLLGKPSGSYSIQVPGGFANVVAKKLRSTEFTLEDIHCVYRGG